MIKVSDTASKKIIEMMQEDGFDAANDYVRVGVKSGGCSGLSYELKFDNYISLEELNRMFLERRKGSPNSLIAQGGRKMDSFMDTSIA